MRRLQRVLRIMGVGLVVYIGVSRLDAWPTSVSVPASAVDVAPILPEEVMFSQAPINAAALWQPNANLTLLEDSGAAIAALPTNRSRGNTNTENASRVDSLISTLRSTESSFQGIGLEGAAKVNGETFSWANVNLSNISYG